MGGERSSASEALLADALQRARYEVIPLPGAEDAVVEHVPADVKVTVTASPAKGIEETLRLAERLAGRGYAVVPHLSARLVRDAGHLGEILGRLADAGVTDAFVIAGDAPEPAGPYEGAAALLRAMAEAGHELREVGISGYPESHPTISDRTTIAAMYDKVPYATYIVSQICFDAATTAGWVRRVRGRGVDLPIHVGVPGVVAARKLMQVSGKVGLGESARFLRKYGNRLYRLLLPGSYAPDRLLRDLAPLLEGGEVRGFHVYTFNELARTEAWRQGWIHDRGAA